MSHLLVVILSDLKCVPALLDAWQNIDVPGATILDSAGAFRTTTWLSQVGLGALGRLFETERLRSRLVLAAIDDEALLEQAIAEAERVVGDFDRPDSGLLLVLPVAAARGLRKSRPRPASAKPPPPAIRPEWMVRRDTPVERVSAILDLEPTIVRPDTPLDEVARIMLTHPNVHVACVVTDDNRLLGLLALRSLADDLFFHILPEEFLSEITDLEDALEFADLSRLRTAADAMQEPVWVKEGETLVDAFKRMHEQGLSGLPVVDEHYHVVGYINLLELVAACVERGDEGSRVEGTT